MMLTEAVVPLVMVAKGHNYGVAEDCIAGYTALACGS
jgi:hypothetical protein